MSSVAPHVRRLPLPNRPCEPVLPGGALGKLVATDDALWTFEKAHGLLRAPLPRVATTAPKRTAEDLSFLRRAEYARKKNAVRAAAAGVRAAYEPYLAQLTAQPAPAGEPRTAEEAIRRGRASVPSELLKPVPSPARRLAQMEAFRAQLVGSSSSGTWGAHVRIAKAVEQPGWSEPALRSAMDELFALTRGKGSRALSHLTFTSPRGYADDSLGEINVGDSGSKRALFHELGHFVEREHPQRFFICREWTQSRSTFVDPYVGRTYGDALGSEVLSTGLEHFADAASMVELLTRDPEHFFLTLGLVVA